MCGRTVNTLDGQAVRRYYPRAQRYVDQEKHRAPRYNVAPTTYQPVLRFDQTAKEYVVHEMRWGLIPHWAKEMPAYGDSMTTINARDDSLIENKPMWNAPKQSGRCVVICDGFYEWLKEGKDGKERSPYYITRKDGQPLLFAGLYDKCTLDDNTIYSYSIVTTHSSKDFEWLHNRMPVILHNETEVDKWISPGTKFLEGPCDLLRPAENVLKWHAVSKFVSKTGNDSIECITPLKDHKKQGNLSSFFGKAPASTSSGTQPSPTSTSPVTADVHPEKRKREDDVDHEKKGVPSANSQEHKTETISSPPPAKKVMPSPSSSKKATPAKSKSIPKNGIANYFKPA
ncbi:hypothetical protein SmJEL517_g00134 [Synchytrium microbalum]|uniref:DUF159-domain-containing protein n=1 Tax=Synchytrium microbalum TaxID=1806994 RepID=A0A507CB70_9FUNG|nr:uncharacterized protein SmJEL517_g00134 [Synchytrium microbalum]TPX38307.1 hypothetical protein SmJEL517_g00134 [Synchytrium microbalum]